MTTDKQCPLCKSHSFTIIELWRDHAIYFEVESSVIDRHGGALEPGSPYKLEGKCRCGHRWTIPKANQIDDIIN